MQYIGLDVHRRKIEVCIIDGEGKVVRRTQVAASRRGLVGLARECITREDQVVLEATTNCWAVVEVLQPYVGRIAVANPVATLYIARARVKTDKVDAWALAQLLRTGFLPEVWTPDEQTIRLRRLTHRRAALVAQATAIKNRIHSVLAMELMEALSEDLFGSIGRAWLQEAPLSEDGRETVECELRLLDATGQEIERLEVRLSKLAYANEAIRLLMTITGVDMAVAAGLASAVGDITRFQEAGQLASYLGLAPRTRQSADHCYHGSISKAGNSHARWLLVQAAWVVVGQPGPLAAFFKKVSKRRGRNIAIVAVARKLAVIAWHILTNKEPYRYASPASTAAKLAKLRIRATGQRRKGGLPKGEGRHPNYGSGQGTKRTPGLVEVCHREGLPLPKAVDQLPAGELRLLKTNGGLALIHKYHQSSHKPRAAKSQHTCESEGHAEGKDVQVS
jgi:transposase